LKIKKTFKKKKVKKKLELKNYPVSEISSKTLKIKKHLKKKKLKKN
jgi:hypothetical protein